MSDRGLVANHRNGWPSRSEILALGLGGRVLRTIVYDQDEFYHAIQPLQGVVKICALLNTETGQVGPEWHGWDYEVSAFAERFSGLVHYTEMGNELDLLGEDPNRGAWAASVAAPKLARASIQPILTSVASSDWPSWLSSMNVQLPPDIKALCWANLHPYGQRVNGYPPGFGFGEMTDAVELAHYITGLPVAMTESGIKIGDAGGESQQATYVTRWNNTIKSLPNYVCPFAAYFCWNDATGSPGEQGDQAFGLRRADMSKRPAWTTMQRALGGSQVPEYAYAQGFAEMWRSNPSLVGEPLENESGLWLNSSMQRTTNGLLVWGHYHASGSRHAFFANDGSRYIWDAGQLVPVGTYAAAAATAQLSPEDPHILEALRMGRVQAQAKADDISVAVVACAMGERLSEPPTQGVG